MSDTLASTSSNLKNCSVASTGRELSDLFKVWLCDIWGVVHNGEQAHPAACDALQKHRENGGVVILITNAPRPFRAVMTQLDGLQVPHACYDAIVTSGDVTRELVAAYSGGKVFFLGPERDAPLREGLSVEWSDIQNADAVLCTGLYNDKTDQPEDYDGTLREILDRNLKMICANPDVIVQFGNRLLPCAGALAGRYRDMGGIVEMAGKPFPPIYKLSIERASEVLGRDVERKSVLAIGDGMQTDITGGRDNDLAVAFITGGIHDEEIGRDGSTQDMANIARDAVEGVNIAGAMRVLGW